MQSLRKCSYNGDENDQKEGNLLIQREMMINKEK